MNEPYSQSFVFSLLPNCLSPLGCIRKSLVVKGKTGTENITDGALQKRTIFSCSLTAAAFPDGVWGVERQS